MPNTFAGDGYSITRLPKGEWLALRLCTKCDGTGYFPPQSDTHPAGQEPSVPCPVKDCVRGARVCRTADRDALKKFAFAPDPV